MDLTLICWAEEHKFKKKRKQTSRMGTKVLPSSGFVGDSASAVSLSPAPWPWEGWTDLVPSPEAPCNPPVWTGPLRP